MKKFLVNNVWWITLLLGFLLLVAHTFSFEMIKVDNTSIIILLVIFLSPFISAITKIKFGEFEAEIDPKEVQKIKDEVSTQVSKDEKPAKNSETELAIKSINDLVTSDPILALAKLRIELERVVNKLYRISNLDSRPERNLPLGNIVTYLSKAEVLPKDIARTTREIISICNRAIHGEDIRDQDAKLIVESGTDLLSELSFNVSMFIMKPIEKLPIDLNTVREFESAQYRVTTIVPLVDSPYKSIYITNQEGINEMLEGYDEYAEYIIEIKKVNAENNN